MSHGYMIHSPAENIIKGTTMYPNRDKSHNGPYEVRVYAPNMELKRVISHEELVERAKQPVEKFNRRND